MAFTEYELGVLLDDFIVFLSFLIFPLPGKNIGRGAGCLQHVAMVEAESCLEDLVHLLIESYSPAIVTLGLQYGANTVLRR